MTFGINKGAHHEREYIAAQEPVPDTVDDFIRMVYENQAKVIVMLTKLVEGEKVCGIRFITFKPAKNYTNPARVIVDRDRGPLLRPRR